MLLNWEIIKQDIILYMYIANQPQKLSVNVKSIQETTYQLCREITLFNFNNTNHLVDIHYLLELYINGVVTEDFLRNKLLLIKPV
jgi:hypothetical protein